MLPFKHNEPDIILKACGITIDDVEIVFNNEDKAREFLMRCIKGEEIDEKYLRVLAMGLFKAMDEEIAPNIMSLVIEDVSADNLYKELISETSRSAWMIMFFGYSDDDTNKTSQLIERLENRLVDFLCKAIPAYLESSESAPGVRESHVALLIVAIGFFSPAIVKACQEIFTKFGSIAMHNILSHEGNA